MARDDGEGDDRSETLDLTEVSAGELRDRLAARSDGREERVVRAAADLRGALDRLDAGIRYRWEAVVTRTGEIARAALPFAGGAAAAGLGALLVARRARRSRPDRPAGG